MCLGGFNINKRYYYITPDDYRIGLRNGISEITVWKRVNYFGWDIDKAITTKVQKRISYTDKEKALMKKNGITQKLVTQRRQDGWSLERAINTPKLKKTEYYKPKRTVFTDEIVEIAKNNGISYVTFRDRVKKLGWSWEEASTIPILKSGSEYKNKHIWRDLENARREECNSRRNLCFITSQC